MINIPITMDQMVAYLVERGFTVHKTYQSSDKRYQFVIIKDNHTEVSYFKYPENEETRGAYMQDFCNRMIERFIKNACGYLTSDTHPEITILKVIFNDPATIVLWSDGTKTVVKAENESFDPEKGLAMAIAKKSLGNKGNYFEIFKKWVPKKEEPAEHSEPSKPMTYREKLQKEHPDKIGTFYCGGCAGCPGHYGYGPETCWNCGGGNVAKCKKCWDTVIPDNKKEG